MEVLALQVVNESLRVREHKSRFQRNMQWTVNQQGWHLEWPIRFQGWLVPPRPPVWLRPWFYQQRLQCLLECCRAAFQLLMKWKIDLWAVDLDSAVYDRREECFLRRLLRDRSGTTPEVNNSKRRSLRSALRVGKPGPDHLRGRGYCLTVWAVFCTQRNWLSTPIHVWLLVCTRRKADFFPRRNQAPLHCAWRGVSAERGGVFRRKDTWCYFSDLNITPM